MDGSLKEMLVFGHITIDSVSVNNHTSLPLAYVNLVYE
jgi:hypothetical protein